MRHAVLPKAEGARPRERTVTGGLHSAAAVCNSRAWALQLIVPCLSSHCLCPPWAPMLTPIHAHTTLTLHS